MRKNLLKKLRESLQSILPITVLVLILALVFTKVTGVLIALFLISAVCLIVGMTLFSLGADTAMMPIGQNIGAFLSKSKKSKFWLVALVSLVIGFVITIAEPDLIHLSILLGEDGAMNVVVLCAVAGGVGMFLIVSIFKTFFKIKLKYLLLGFYAVVFALAVVINFVNPDFLALSFDSGGVTTGPITVPFLMALGIGIASVRGGNSDSEDSFGTVALCSVGPIIAVMILGVTGFKLPENHSTVLSVDKFSQILSAFISSSNGLLGTMKTVAIALIPIVAVFFLFQFFVLKLPKSRLIRIIIGIVYTYVGLTIFLTGVNVGFETMGRFIGAEIASLSYNWILIPIGIAFGAVVVLAEPAVHILNKEVEEITGGAVSKRSMMIFLSCGVAISVGLAMVRVLTGISIWWFIVPVYIVSIALMFIVPPIFTGIAFDSGGVASGPMTATFMLPLAIGACDAIIANTGAGAVYMDAFGLVAFVAMTPLIAIQLLGLMFKLKKHRALRREKVVEPAAPVLVLETQQPAPISSDDTIEFDFEPHTTIIDVDEVANEEHDTLIENEENNTSESEKEGENNASGH